jgi:branched-chain amino acid transport system substrate-binding protein
MTLVGRSHLAVLASIFALAACGDEESKTVKVGVIYPQTGPSAGDGVDFRAGVDLAVEVINARLPNIPMGIANNEGIKALGNAKLEVVYMDDAGDGPTGVAAANSLVDNDKVNIIMASYQSAVTQAVAGAMNDRAFPVLNAASSSPTLTTNGWDWFWRTTPHDRYFVQDLFTFLNGLSSDSVRGVPSVAKADITRIGAICEKTAFGSGNCSLIQQFAADPKYSYTVTAAVLYDSAAANLPAEISAKVDALLVGDPQVILTAGYNQDTIDIVQEIRARVQAHTANEPKIIWGQDTGISSSAFQTALGHDLNGIISRSVFLPAIAQNKAVAATINDMYNAENGRSLNSAASRSFTGMQTIAEILELAASTNVDHIRQAANTLLLGADELIVPWQGVKFSSAGDANGEVGQNILGSGVIYQYQYQGETLTLQLVYPFELATADMIFPFTAFSN